MFTQENKIGREILQQKCHTICIRYLRELFKMWYNCMIEKFILLYYFFVEKTSDIRKMKTVMHSRSDLGEFNSRPVVGALQYLIFHWNNHLTFRYYSNEYRPCVLTVCEIVLLIGKTMASNQQCSSRAAMFNNICSFYVNQF